jgi:hypothetical protein
MAKDTCVEPYKEAPIFTKRTQYQEEMKRASDMTKKACHMKDVPMYGGPAPHVVEGYDS